MDNSIVIRWCSFYNRITAKPNNAKRITAKPNYTPVTAGEPLIEIDLAGVKREEDGRAILDRVRQWLMTAMTADGAQSAGRVARGAWCRALNARERVEAGNVLAQLGDPRFDPENWFLPDDGCMGFVEIPAASSRRRTELGAWRGALCVGR